MALPSTIKPMSKDEWIKAGNSTDAAQRKLVTDALRAMGMASPDYMPLSTEDRVALIMKQQDEGGGAADSKPSGKKDAVKADSAASSGGGGGGGMSAADRALLKSIDEKLDAARVLNEKIHDLLVVQIFTDPKVKANAEDLGVKVALINEGNG